MQHGRVSRIDIFKLSIPLSRPFRNALGIFHEASGILVRIFAEDGEYGLGEASPVASITGESQSTAFEAARMMGRILIGKDAYEIGGRISEIDALFVDNSSAKSAYDIALYDLLGKHLGLPIYSVLGGQPRTIETDRTIGIDSPDTMAKEALEHLEKGFRKLKVKLGTSRDEDVARIHSIRGRVGPGVAISVDANQGWDPKTAEAVLNDLAPYAIEYCEQPVARWNRDAMAYIRRRSPIPIMADEALFDHHDAFALAKLGACDYFNIKLAKSGGINRALKIAVVAESSGIPCMIGSMFETRVGLSAAAHVVFACPNIVFADLDTAFSHAEDPVVGGITFSGGEVTVPSTPGLGADIEPNWLERQERTTIE